jgi:di/tricarboxylate transporter
VEAVEAGDRLVFAASEVGVKTLWESPRFGLSPQHLYAVSVGPGEHGTLLELEDDDLPVIAAQTAKPLGDTTAIPGATVFVTCSSTEDLLTPRMAVRALDWNVLFILAGSVGLGAIVVRRTNLITNAAAASILTPVALGIATKLELDPVTLLALVATCISFTFINPFSHQTNLMVMGPGAYSTRTFAKFGALLVAVSLPQ